MPFHLLTPEQIAMITPISIAVIPLLISLLALILSYLSYYRSNIPLTIIEPTIDLQRGPLHVHPTSDSFQVMSAKDHVFISFRIINPRASDLTIFNIQVDDNIQDGYCYNYLRKLHFGLSDEQNVYMLFPDPTSFLKVNMPLSHYQRFPSTSFAHFDIAIDLEDILLRKPQALRIVFRDSRYRFFKKNRFINPTDLKLNHPCHCYYIDISPVYNTHQAHDESLPS